MKEAHEEMERQLEATAKALAQAEEQRDWLEKREETLEAELTRSVGSVAGWEERLHGAEQEHAALQAQLSAAEDAKNRVEVRVPSNRIPTSMRAHSYELRAAMD